MASVITAEAEEIENTASIESTVQSDMLRGVVKRAGSLILLLDPARLTTEGSAAQARSASGATTFSSGTNGVTTVARSETEAGVPDEIQLVSFEADAQEYAFAIDDVQEIVQVPGTVTQVPQAQPHVVGVMTLRDRLLPSGFAAAYVWPGGGRFG